MLNPPLSLLSDELLAYIVEHVAKLPSSDEHLYSLSLADRAFTQSCQKYIFRTLKLSDSGGPMKKISKKLKRTQKLLNDKASFAHQVRTVQLAISHKQNAWFFNDPNPPNNPTLISIFQPLAKSPMPPHELHFGGQMFRPLIIEDPILVVRWLAQSFFSQTLTVLHLKEITNVPFPLLLICPRLREVHLDCVGITEESHNKYPDNLCSGQELPALEVLNYRDSQSLVKQMITPPPRFNTLGVFWSNLRVLTLSPHEKEEMACLQPILDAANNTLEELYLTSLKVGRSQQRSLAGLVNFGDVSCLHVFALYAIIKCGAPESAVLHDINIVLRTIPESNQITNLSFDFNIVGQHPFHGCLDQDWVAMFDEVIRISAGKPLELELQTTVSTENLDFKHPGQDELYMNIMNRMASLSDYPNICTHFWNPNCRAHGLGSFPRGQVRSKCGR